MSEFTTHSEGHPGFTLKSEGVVSIATARQEARLPRYQWGVGGIILTYILRNYPDMADEELEEFARVMERLLAGHRGRRVIDAVGMCLLNGEFDVILDIAAGTADIDRIITRYNAQGPDNWDGGNAA